MLGAFSILKEDNFPGMQSSKIAQTIEGASNFRWAPGLTLAPDGRGTLSNTAKKKDRF